MEAVDESRRQFDQALIWHRRQETDLKLRLKAIASGFMVEESGHIHCPLCERELEPSRHSNLIADLATLNSGAEFAERRLDDACRSIREKVLACAEGVVPAPLIKLGVREVRGLVMQDVRKRFLDADELKSQLPGLQAVTAVTLSNLEQSIPELRFGVAEPERTSPDGDLSALLDHLGAVAAVSGAWNEARAAYRDGWSQLLDESQQGSLRELAKSAITAVNEAEPYRTASGHIRAARAEAKKFDRLWCDNVSARKLRSA